MGPFINSLTDNIQYVPDAAYPSEKVLYLPVAVEILQFSEAIASLAANDSYFASCERDEKGHCTTGGGSGAASGGKGGGKSSSKDEGIDIEARPVEGAGKAGKGTAAKGVAITAKKSELGAVDKWLAGEGEKSNHPAAAAIRAVTEKIGHLEHAGKAIAVASAQYVKDKVADSTSRLPGPAQKVANAAFIGLRTMAGVGRAGVVLGAKAAFSYWTGITEVAGRVAERKGANPEQGKKIRAALSAIDMGSLEAAKGGAIASLIPALSHALHFSHAAAKITASLPVASCAYLAANGVRHPIHTIMAASSAIADLGKATGKIIAHPVKTAKAIGREAASEFKKGYNIGGVSKAATKSGQQAAQSQARAQASTGRRPVRDMVHHAQGDPSSKVEGVANMVADALEAHGYSDWYLALFSAALDAGEKVPDAIDSANAAYAAQPKSPIPDDFKPTPKDDDDAMTAVFGSWIHDVK